MKKLLTLLLSLVLLAGLTACAGADSASEAAPVQVYGNEDLSSSAVFETVAFACTEGNGDALRYGFQNTGDSPCTVQLYEKTVLGLEEVQEAFPVAIGEEKEQVFPDPGGRTFQIRVTATDGGVVTGKLQAEQLDLTND